MDITYKNTFASTPYLDVPDTIKQAFRRIALNGNPHWMRYSSGDGVPGKNDVQSSTGHLTNGGVNLQRYSYWPYWFSQQTIDEKMQCHGFWSRSDEGVNSTHRFICYDLEPLTPAGAHKTQGNAHHAQVRAEAQRVYDAYLQLAETTCPEIILVLLVESSAHAYHVWVLLEYPVSKAEHDAIVHQARRIHGAPANRDGSEAGDLSKLHNRDKDSTRAEGRFGDHYRGPWTWKHGRRSEALALWIKNEQRLYVELNKSQHTTRSTVAFTHDQIIRVIESRHGVRLDEKQIQRLKWRYISYTRKYGGWHTATRCELLTERLKGVPRIASEFAITRHGRTLFCPEKNINNSVPPAEPVIEPPPAEPVVDSGASGHVCPATAPTRLTTELCGDNPMLNCYDDSTAAVATEIEHLIQQIHTNGAQVFKTYMATPAPCIPLLLLDLTLGDALYDLPVDDLIATIRDILPRAA